LKDDDTIYVAMTLVKAAQLLFANFVVGCTLVVIVPLVYDIVVYYRRRRVGKASVRSSPRQAHQRGLATEESGPTEAGEQENE